MEKTFFFQILLKEKSFLQRMIFALGMTALAAFSTVQLNKFEYGNLYSLNLVAVILTALYGGLIPAFTTAVLSSLLLDYFVIPPYGEFFSSGVTTIRVIMYFLTAALISSLMGALRVMFRQLNNARSEAQLASNARENVIGVVSHDLKNPVHAILLNSQTITREMDKGVNAGSMKTIRKANDLIYRAASQMSHLVQDLLDAVRIERGIFSLSLSSTSVRELIDETVKRLRSQADQRGIKFQIQVDGESPVISCDRSRIIQALENYLSNAIRHSPDGGTVWITEKAIGPGFVRFSVKDEGRGIPPEDLPRVFDQFWQGLKPRGENAGAGLGLFIVKGIVNSHNGAIGVRSTLGMGSEFWFDIPISQAASAENQSAEDEKRLTRSA